MSPFKVHVNKASSPLPRRPLLPILLLFFFSLLLPRNYFTFKSIYSSECRSQMMSLARSRLSFKECARKIQEICWPAVCKQSRCFSFFGGNETGLGAGWFQIIGHAHGTVTYKHCKKNASSPVWQYLGFKVGKKWRAKGLE